MNNRICLVAGVAAGLLLGHSALHAQQKKVTPYYPDHQEVLASYQRARQLDSSLKRLPLLNVMKPGWQAQGTSFWYREPLKNYEYQFYLVDALKGTRQLAFDHKRMAAALSKALNKPQSPLKLTITDLVFDADGRQVKIKSGDGWLLCNLQTYTCEKTTAPATASYDASQPLQPKRGGRNGFRTDSVSPDKQWTARIKGGNLYTRSAGGEVQLTIDGSVAKPYGRLVWSPDSRHLVAYHIDPKETKPVYNLLSSVAGTTRAQLTSHPYAQPGDEFTSYEMHVFNIADKSDMKVDADKIDFFGAPVLHWRNGNSRYFTYEKVDRGHQRFRVTEVDVNTGKAKNIIDEKTKTFIYEQRIYTRYLPQTNQVVWITEQDGWRHIYLVNSLTGAQKLVTKGNWVVRDIDSVDAQKKEIWFSASGINPNEDPYFVHDYRIGFDGKNMVNLTPEAGNHNITFSPDRKYYLDTYSQVNIAPVTNLRNTATTRKIMEVQHTDAAPFVATGAKLPEVFVAKARDGKTDIWGIICRPGNMDPAKTYPVIENIYAGPQDSFVPKNFLPYGEMQSMAELGFIVVQIDGLGTANRSKAFHDVCWKNLADAGLPDRILWIKAMAAKYPQADTSRVGIYGTSAGGQNSMGAMLFHPEFYKACVSACGCHDNRIDKQWWNEQWMGYPVGPHYDAQSNITNAAKLKGNLLLIVGEADSNVPPESTYRLADALIKANKYFDFLTIPGANHTDGGPYGRRKKRDFFVKHLLHADAPETNTDELASAGDH